MESNNLQDWEPLSLKHQAILEDKFKKLHIDISEYTFANLYLFRDIHEYAVHLGPEIFIRGKMRDGSSYIMPSSSPENWMPGSIEEFVKQKACLFPIPQEWLKYFEKHMAQTSFSEADSDYLFLVEKIAHYPGRQLSKKRNLVKQFMEHHKVIYKPFTSQDCHAALHILDLWQKESGQAIEDTDYRAFLEAIKNFEKLHLHGCQFDVDGEPGGLMIGEWLNPGCYVLHFNKARKDILGLYQFMYQHLALALEGKCRYINLEQDLGMPSIRQAKHSYQPDRLVHKYRVYLQ